MTLKELQKMIKEEFDAYIGEQEDDVDVSVNPDSDVDAEMGDDDMAGQEDVLRKIYDLLATHFDADKDDEGDMDETYMDEEMDEDMMDEEMDEDMMDEVKDSDDKKEAADMEEASNMGYGDAGNKKTSGTNAGYTPAKTTKGDGKLHESKTALQERFQKLANIIK